MRGNRIFLTSAALAFTLALVSGAKAAWFYGSAAGASCKAIRGLPQTGYFGELWTNPSDGPYGDTYYGGISCFYQEQGSNAWTGQIAPKVTSVSLDVTDGDSHNDSYHSYDFRGSLCVQTNFNTFYWCSPTKYRTQPGGYDSGLTGWGSISFTSQYYVLNGAWGPWDMPVILNGKTWGDQWLGASKIIYVNMPSSSYFWGWIIGNDVPVKP
jgi:hypothetical protein